MGRMVMPYSMPVFVLDTFFADRVSVYVMQVEKKERLVQVFWFPLRTHYASVCL